MLQNFNYFPMNIENTVPNWPWKNSRSINDSLQQQNPDGK